MAEERNPINGNAADGSESSNKEKHIAKKNNILKVLLGVSGILLILLTAAYFLLTWYVQNAKKTEGTDTLQVNGTQEQPLPDDTSALEEDIALEELELRLMEEYEAGVLEGEQNILEQIRLGLSEGTSLVETLRPLYKDHLVVASSGKYHFVPINEAMKKNDYSEENLLFLENGELQYQIDGIVTSYKGIDVSKFQGEIDWQKVAEDGVSFAFVRAGYRGYGSNGTLVEDATAAANLQGANEAGVKVGVYFYTQAITREEALEEAQLVMDLIEPYQIDCPVVIDVEKVSNADGRMNGIDPALRTEIVKTFCEAVAAAGYKPMVYHNLEMGALMLNLEELEEYDKWFAYYKQEMYYPYAYDIWQYSDKGHVNGINGAVDLNIAFNPFWEK